MAKQLQKLELTWIGKGNEPKLEPRILIEDPKKSCGDPKTENMLIHGDNLLALKALEQEFTGRIKGIYIDPPFNTGAAFENYDDGIEHSIWLDLMYRRIQILYKLLHKKGSIFIHLDDNEIDYCKVIMDNVFGRSNFINRITVEARSPSAFSTVNPGVFKSSEYILWYAKNKQDWESRSMRIPTQRDTAYNKYITNRNQHEIDWEIVSLKQAFLEKLNEDKLDKINRILEVIFKEGKNRSKSELANLITQGFPLYVLFNLKQVVSYLFTKLKIDKFEDFWSAVYLYILDKCSYNYSEKDIDEFVFENADAVFRDTEISDEGAGQETVDLKYKSIEEPGRILKLDRTKGLDSIYVLNGKQISFYKKNVGIVEGKQVATKLLTNVWSDISWEGIASEGGVKFKKGKKPERLLKRFLELTTNEGDFVLDSFLGSGTTAAVSHKFRRKWIGIELGEQANTHCLPRLTSIVGGDDWTGITDLVNWKGGGGFKFYSLAPSLLKQDQYGNWVIDEKYNPDMLAAAVAKQEGFHYTPDETIYWKQGKSSEKDFIFTTTRFITVEMLDKLHEEMKPDESLLICCKSYKKECQNRHINISIKKIPQMLLGRCEFSKDDYSLTIVNLPQEEEKEVGEESVQAIETVEMVRKQAKGKKAKTDNNPTLF